MIAAIQVPFARDEASRVATLRALDLLDTAPEQDYDAIVALAAQLLGKPTAFISLMDSERQWLKARRNIDFDETPREIAFCDHVIRDDSMLVIDDAALDPRFRDNPLVAPTGGIRFYAGTPIHATAADGSAQPIGTLCVVDEKPGSLDEDGRRALRHLATLTEALIAARAAAHRSDGIADLAERQAADLARKDRTFRQAERMTKIGSWRFIPAGQAIEWSEGVFRIHGLENGALPRLDEALDFYPPHARTIVETAMAKTFAEGVPFDVEVDFVTATGEPRRVRSMGEADFRDGAVVALVGVFQDITDRHSLEQVLRRTADSDELTGIANRAAFNRALGKAIGAQQRQPSPVMLALIDLDGFKEVNDTLGHLAGDDVLRAVGRRLSEPWLRNSFAARMGGDEFALIVEDPSLIADPAAFVERLQEELCVPVSAGGLTIAASGTVGTAMLGTHDNARDFIHTADTELYAAKRRRIGNRRRGERRQPDGVQPLLL